MTRIYTLFVTASILGACSAGAARLPVPPVATVAEDPDPIPMIVASEDRTEAEVPAADLPEPYVTYRLRRGESLAHFARWAELPVEAIAADSDLPLDAPLAVGTEVRFAADHDTRSAVEVARDAHHRVRAEGYLNHRGGAVGTDFYTVRTGDTAWSIAASHSDIPVWLVETFNPSLDLDALRPGQEVMLPILADSIDVMAAMAPPDDPVEAPSVLEDGS